MSSWTGEWREFCVEVYILNNCIITTQCAFCKQFKLKLWDPVPSPQKIRQWRENVRTKGIANNEERGRSKPGRPKSVCKEETVKRVQKTLIISPAPSGWRHAASLRIKFTSWQRIIKKNLNMHPYKIQITQQVKDRLSTAVSFLWKNVDDGCAG